jgi:uncharacterized protein (DUF3820 family)
MAITTAAGYFNNYYLLNIYAKAARNFERLFCWKLVLKLCLLNPYLYAMESVKPDSKILIEIVQTKMPFGKYKGTLISDLPVYYLEWLRNKGFPPGKMGMLLSSVYEIKINGLNSILSLVKTTLKR